MTGFIYGGLLAASALAGQAQPVEEVLVQATRGCGMWPIAHAYVMSYCTYAELKDEVLPEVLSQRPELAGTCLVCDASNQTCQPRRFSAAESDRARMCQRVFWTPVEVLPMVNRQGIVQRSIDVSFTFAVSQTGTVQDIEINYISGFTKAATARLIRDGAITVTYAPLIIDDVAYRLINLEGNYILD